MSTAGPMRPAAGTTATKVGTCSAPADAARWIQPGGSFSGAVDDGRVESEQLDGGRPVAQRVEHGRLLRLACLPRSAYVVHTRAGNRDDAVTIGNDPVPGRDGDV